MNRLILLVTSPRVAAGLLSQQAWEELRQADAVLCRGDNPQLPALAAAGITVTPLAEQAILTRDDALSDHLLAAAAQANVVYLTAPDGEPELGRALARRLPQALDSGNAPELELLPASWDLPGANLVELVAVMDRLRSPGGCPWDAAQTHESLVTYLLEETYETLEAIETDDPDALREELGDLLLQVIFHARLAEERTEGPWSIDDVAAAITSKLRRRHPKVFASMGAADEAPMAGGSASEETLEDLEASWQQQKTREKSRESVLDGIPMAQPALLLASKMISRVERGGLSVALPSVADEAPADARLGVELLALVQQARSTGIDPEAALRGALRAYAEDVRLAEAG